MSRRLIRITLFLGFLGISVGLGLMWHSGASKDEHSTLPEVAIPLSVNAWTTQPDQQVSVSVTVASDAVGAPHTFALVTVAPSSRTTSVVLTASRPSTTCVSNAVPASGMPKAGIGVLPYGYTAHQGQDVLCSFALSDDAVTDDGKVIQAKLPAIQQVLLTLRTSSTPSGPSGVTANGIAYQFAQHVATSDTVFGLGTKITQGDDDLVTNFPSYGTANGDFFTWQGGGSNFPPELRAVSRDLEDERGNDDFRSGIAFAIAAAAAVALAQEIPDREKPPTAGAPAETPPGSPAETR